jgi:hypothetical protein
MVENSHDKKGEMIFKREKERKYTKNHGRDTGQLKNMVK